MWSLSKFLKKPEKKAELFIPFFWEKKKQRVAGKNKKSGEVLGKKWNPTSRFWGNFKRTKGLVWLFGENWR